MHSHTFIASGGGTGGSVSPLLAMLEAFPDARVHWVGTRHWQQEREMIEQGSTLMAKKSSATGGSAFGGNLNRCIEFHRIFSGKFRRYWDIRNLTDPFLVFLGFIQSLWLLRAVRPCAVLTAGGYVAVPVAWAAWVLGIPVVVYEQDVNAGLANRLMKPIASLTLSIRNGALVRGDRVNGDAARARTRWKLEPGLPTVLVIGGGTGSQFLNDLVIQNLSTLTEFFQIIHITGDAKRHPEPRRGISSSKLLMDNYELSARYHSVSFLGPELADVYAIADVVVTRAGMGVLTELAANKKAAIVIPLPGTHQEQNTALVEKYCAGIVLQEATLTPSIFVKHVCALLEDSSERERLGSALRGLFPLRDLSSTRARFENIMRCSMSKNRRKK